MRILAVILVLASACGDDDGGGEPPLQVGEREWTWIPVEGSRCMDGSATGFGINLDAASDRLVVFLEGGGACYDDASCAAVAHQDGFGAADLARFAAGGGTAGIFDRDAPDNPLADWSYLFVPYCSGDVHAGATEAGLGGRIHDGFANVTRAVTRVAGDIDGLSRVLLTGQSAGGFGATYNFDQVQQLFVDVPVDLLNDSGPPLADQYLHPCLQTLWRDSWNLAATTPPDCDACTTSDGGGFINLITFASTKYPASRLGLVSSLRDITTRQIYGLGYPDCENPTIPMPAETFSAALSELRDTVIGATPNTRTYYIDSDNHVWTHRDLATTKVNTVSLAAWLTAMVRGESWEHVSP
jgi:hypothetical protein